MARKLRIHYPGALYHLMLCSNGGADIFFAKADRKHFHDWGGEGGSFFEV